MYSSGLLAGGKQKLQNPTGAGRFCDITYYVCRYEFPYKEYTQFLAFFCHEDTKTQSSKIWFKNPFNSLDGINKIYKIIFIFVYPVIL